MSKVNISTLEKFVLSTFIYLPLVLTPNLTIDAVNLGKFFLFVLGSVTAIFILAKSRMSFYQDKRLRILTTLFLLGIVLPFFLSKAPLDQQLIGVWGRNIGLLTYVSCFITLLFGYSLIKKKPGQILWNNFLICSLISIAYGLFQAFGYDYIDWNAPAVFGTMGNINFYSAHLAIIISMFIGFSLSTLIGSRVKLFLFALGCLCAYLLVKANSAQGIVIVFIMLLLASHVVLSRRSRKLRFLIPSFVGLLFLLLISGLLRMGPHATFVSNQMSSLKIRSFFWQAALRMFKEHLFFGVGLDSFEDWYLVSRPLAAFQGGDLNEPADSAHNFLLEYGAVGGIALFLFGVYLMTFVISRFTRVVSKAVSIPSELSCFESAFCFGSVAFLLQGLVSPQQIGILSWGFLLLGITLGYGETLVHNSQRATKGKSTIHNKANLQKSSRIFVSSSLTIFAVMALVVSVSPIVKERKMLSAQRTENIQYYVEAVGSFPKSAYYYRNGIRIMENAGFYAQSMVIAKNAVVEFPRNYSLLDSVTKLRIIDTTWKENLRHQLESLNPPR